MRLNSKQKHRLMQIDIAGKVREKKLAAKNALLPLFEAIVNSIHAIEEGSSTAQGIIEIEAERSAQIRASLSDEELKEEKSQIIGFIITDNGIGFNEANYESFNFAHSSYKLNKGGKGIGRITWLRAFNRVEIDSIYKKNGSIMQRKFNFLFTRDGIEDHEIKEIDGNSKRLTKVHLKSLRSRYHRWTNNDLEEIAFKIIEHCFSFFREEDCPLIVLKDSDDQIVINDYFKQYTKSVITSIKEKVKGEDFLFEVARIYSSRIDNKIHYRAHRREVMNEKLTDHIPELNSLLEDENGDKYSLAVYVSSDYLDDKVNEERTEIAFSRADTLFSDEIQKEDLSTKVDEIVRKLYHDHLGNIEQANLDNVRSFIQNHPRYRYLEKYKKNKLKKIPSTIKGKALDVELFKIQAELETEIRRDANKMLSSIKDLNHKENFDKEHTKIYNKIIEVGNSKLAEYVVHRSYILKLLETHLKKSENGKYSKEELVHSLIFPLRKTSNEIQLEEHNLWVIDERLAFHDYLASDIPFTTMERTDSKSLKRSDIIVFNKAHILNDDKPYSSITIVEFKKPMRDDYTDADNPISQVTNYAVEILENKAIDKNGRPISVRTDTPFYAYIISDLTPKIRKLAEGGGYTKLPDNDGYFSYNPNYKLYIEIISFDKIVRDSKKRNQILFSKLNLPTV